jgi:hypothetical protein
VFLWWQRIIFFLKKKSQFDDSDNCYGKVVLSDDISITRIDNIIIVMMKVIIQLIIIYNFFLKKINLTVIMIIYWKKKHFLYYFKNKFLRFEGCNHPLLPWWSITNKFFFKPILIWILTFYISPLIHSKNISQYLTYSLYTLHLQQIHGLQVVDTLKNS